MTLKYSHVVSIDDTSRLLRIDRLYEDGRRVLYTQTELPKFKTSDRKKEFSEFALMLGENLLFDSSTGRQLHDESLA